MPRLRCSFFSLGLSLCLGLLAVTSAHAQQTTSPRPCVSDWGCGSARPPLGFYVDSVSDDGRYVRLEDGTLWEILIDNRAAVAGWERGLFLEVRRILAPTGDYEWQFINGDDPHWRAAARFVGRTR